MQYDWEYEPQTRQRVRVKVVDYTYCLHCQFCKSSPRARFEYCKYDGMPIEQTMDDEFEMWCHHFQPWKIPGITLY